MFEVRHTHSDGISQIARRDRERDNSNGNKRGVEFHLLGGRLHNNLSLLTSVSEVVVSGTDIVVHSCCSESQQSPFKRCRGIVQELLEWRITRLD